MKKLLYFGFFVSLLVLLYSCNGQTNAHNQTKSSSLAEKTILVGGGCDGCELMYVGMPTTIPSLDTSSGWTKAGQNGSHS